MENQPTVHLNLKLKRLPRAWKDIIIFVILLGVLMGSLAVFINFRWKPYLTRQIQEAITTSTDGLYSITFQNISVNVITGSATLKNIAFKPDSLVYARMIKEGLAPKHLFTVEVARLDLNRVHPFKVYFQRKLEMTSLLLNRPTVRMIYQKVSSLQDTVADNRNAYQRLSKYLRSIKVDDIIFQDADFQYIDRTAKRNQVARFQNLDIAVQGLLIDSASQFNQSKLYYTDNISIQLDKYEFRTPNGLYDLKLNALTASTRNKFVKIEGFKLIPRYSEMQFSAKVKTRMERYALRYDEMLLEGINFKAFNTDRRLLASKLTIRNSNSNIFLNKAIPEIKSDRILSFPQNALRQLNLQTRIDSVFIRNARVSYAEYAPQTKLRGLIFFDQIDGTISNLTNDSSTLVNNKISKISLTGLIMGRGRLNAQLELNLTDKASSFTLTGNVGIMNASLLNKILRPMSLVEVRSGFIENVQFALKGNEGGAQGRLSAIYQDLKISVLAKNKESSRLKKMGIASMAANVLIIKGANPLPGESLRQANIQYFRPESASFINMIWKGMMIGLKETIGLDPVTQRKIEDKLSELKTIKAEREERRDERLKRKEERKLRNRK